MLDPGSDFRVLVAGTGAGKTWAAVLPIVLARARAVLVYPTNALLDDQRRSILALFRNHLGVPVQEIGAGDPTGEPGGYTLVRLDAKSLEERRRARHRRTKGAVLAELLDPSGPRLVLTNPDILYQLLAWRYSEPGRHLGSIQAYPHLVLDEFHLYSGVELANLLAMIGVAKAIRSFQRVTVLSATGDDAVLSLLERTIGVQAHRVGEDAVTRAAATGRERVLAHQVELSAASVSRGTGLVDVDALACLIGERRAWLEALRGSHWSEPDYVPAVMILNSVVDARQVEESLITRGWRPEEIAPMRGLVGRAARDPRGRLLVVGTSAIEVGVDFSTDLVCFQGGDRSSFMQRLGRVGRHRSGEAILLGDDREAAAFEAFADERGGEVARTEITDFAQQVYQGRDSMAWFADTEGGATVLLCLEESVCSAIRSDAIGMSQEELGELVGRVREIVAAHAQRVGGEVARQLKRLRTCLQLARTYPKHRYRYLVDLVEAHPTLRTAVPTVQVWDYGEAKRRGAEGARYEVEAVRLARQGRGVRVKRQVDGSRIFVGRYERGGHAWLNETLAPGFHSVREIPGLRLCNPAGTLPLELLGDEKQVLFVADQSIREHVDWRVPLIHCGDSGPGCAALGWGALLLREICRRVEAAQRGVE